MTVLQCLLLVSPFAYSIIVSIVLGIMIECNKFTINLKNLYKFALCYLPVIILATIIAFVIPNSTTEGSLVGGKVLEFILPFVWIIYPICVQKSHNREQKMQQLMDRIEQLESKNKSE